MIGDLSGAAVLIFMVLLLPRFASEAYRAWFMADASHEEELQSIRGYEDKVIIFGFTNQMFYESGFWLWSTRFVSTIRFLISIMFLFALVVGIAGRLGWIR